MGKKRRLGGGKPAAAAPVLWRPLPSLIFKVPATVGASGMGRWGPGALNCERHEAAVAAAHADARAAARGVRSKLGAPLRQDAIAFIMFVHGSEGAFEPQAVHLAAALFDEVVEPGDDTDVVAVACSSLACKFHLPYEVSHSMEHMAAFVTGVDEEFMRRAEWQAMGRAGCDVHIPTVADVLVDCVSLYSARVGAVGEGVRFGAHFLSDCCLFKDARVRSFPPSRLAVACLVEAAAALGAPPPNATETLALDEAEVAGAREFVRSCAGAVCAEVVRSGGDPDAPARTVFRQYTVLRFRCKQALPRGERIVARDAVQRVYDAFVARAA